jgi:hypothetical protein
MEKMKIDWAQVIVFIVLISFATALMFAINITFEYDSGCKTLCKNNLGIYYNGNCFIDNVEWNFYNDNNDTIHMYQNNRCVKCDE